jgi:hypothetical protein
VRNVDALRQPTGSRPVRRAYAPPRKYLDYCLRVCRRGSATGAAVSEGASGVEEGPKGRVGWAANLLGIVAAEGVHDLDDAWIVATDYTPVPYRPSRAQTSMAAPRSRAVRERLGVAVA